MEFPFLVTHNHNDNNNKELTTRHYVNIQGREDHSHFQLYIKGFIAVVRFNLNDEREFLKSK